ncbi:RING/U-box superfamily protein [Prunus dulcis]|uniref:RING/U-box superfamily protein n=1 Tax=Prunus dulcis TaxID=3755 RepID=A0A4Y1RK92_PRUDU|nr:RING/U-box superfamily protein [Prunus dulcis]
MKYRRKKGIMKVRMRAKIGLRGKIKGEDGRDEAFCGTLLLLTQFSSSSLNQFLGLCLRQFHSFPLLPSDLSALFCSHRQGMAEVGESSGAKPSCEIWAKLVPSDSRYPDVEISLDEISG